MADLLASTVAGFLGGLALRPALVQLDAALGPRLLLVSLLLDRDGKLSAVVRIR